MLEHINHYLHGLVAIPVIMALKKQAVFSFMEKEKTCTLADLCELCKLNKGILHIALEMLCSLGWLDLEGETYTCTLTFDQHKSIPENIMELCHFSFKSYLTGKGGGTLAPWAAQVKKRWNCNSPFIADLLDGMLFVPLLLGLHELAGREKRAFKELLSTLPEQSAREITGLFLAKEWIALTEGGPVLTEGGEYVLERIMITAIAYSYKPMLVQMEKLLAGAYQDVFTFDEAGHEVHIDRNLNVNGCGYSHDKFFNDMERAIVSVFDRQPLETQPRYIVDCGCGDGSLLLWLYNAVCSRSLRGKHLDRYPLIMIGVDYNKKSLDETKKRLDGLPHILIEGDIGKPLDFITELEEKHNCHPGHMVHIRSFIDHNRPFEEPEDSRALAEKRRFSYSGAYVNSAGEALAACRVVQSSVEHLKKWASLVEGHGLMLLEVHSLPYRIKREFAGASESLYFDTIHNLSGQYLLEAHIFLLCAAEAGLLPDYSVFKYYPRVFPFRRITLNYFKKRAFSIRNASLDDLEALEKLEISWQPELRSSKDVLKNRLELFPDGQFVMELEGTVIGAAYTQLIRSAEDLKTVSFENQSTLFDRQGKVLQLIGLLILPEYQTRGFSDDFLDFLIHYAALHNWITGIAGVSRCKNYHSRNALSMEEYITQRNENSCLSDPILSFHESHGAEIKEVLYNYRPADSDNEGHGVLIEYSLSAEDLLTASGEEKVSGAPPISRKEIENLLFMLLYRYYQRNT